MEATPADWNFQNPLLSTPKTNAHQPPFQTPRTDPPSHFTDAFYTPQQETPARTPALHEFTIVRKQAKTANAPITPDDPKFYVNHYTNSSNNLQLPPVEPARRLTSSPDPQASSNHLQRTLAVHHSKVDTAPMDGYQMQTPPPTRDSTSRRQYVYGQHGVQSTPSTAYQQGPVSTPAQQPIMPNMQQTPTFQTPGQFTQLQFSPDMWGFPAGGPMTAPAVPQARFPWDSTPPMPQYQHPVNMNTPQQPFGPANPISAPVPSWPSNNVSPVELPSSTFVPSQTRTSALEDGDFWRTAQTVDPQATTFSSDGIFTSPTTGVNPNLLFSFSSPVPSSNPLGNNQETQTDVDFSNRQPYEHQMRESNRERELARKAKQQHSRTNTTSSSLTATARPGLHRSNTDSGFRRNKNRSFESRTGAQSLDAARKPSPLKRLSQASLSSIPESMRPLPRTRLVIDESGRARTETEPVDVPESRSLWDDVDSDDEDELAVPSQRNSFINPTESFRSSKHARNDSGDQPFSASKRPLSSASLASLTSRLESTPLGKKNPRDSMDSSYRRFSMGSFASSQSQSQGNDDVFVEEDSSDARAAVMKLIQERNERDDPQATLRAHNQRWSQASLNLDVAKFPQLQSQQSLPQAPSYETVAPPSISPAYGSSANSSLSPVIPFPAAQAAQTPSSASTASDSSVRCVCGATSPTQGPQSPGLMVQCESCMKWLHGRCVGLNEARLPEVYVCVFCTGTTPLVRGGRIRDGRGFAVGAGGGAGGANASPLNYKNNPFKR